MIDETILAKLSALGRIQVSDQDKWNRLDDLQAILKCIGILERVQIPADFVPVIQVKNHARADIVRPATPETVAGIVENFPDNIMGQLRVPQVLKK